MRKTLKPYNISEKYNYQWIAPERTGSRKVAEFLCYFGFTNYGETIFSSNNYKYTHYCDIYEPEKKFKIICNARNPYARTLSIYRNFINPQSKVNRTDFSDFIKEKLMLTRYINPVQNPKLPVSPDYVVRLEHMSEDLKKIPFVLEKFTSEQVDKMTFHPKPLFAWEEFYDQELKDIVYSYTSHQFEMWGYER